MRKFTQGELIQLVAIIFVTIYLTLQSLLQSKQALEQMFSHEEWLTSAWANKTKGKTMKNIIFRKKKKVSWVGVIYAIKITRLPIGVLGLVDYDCYGIYL